MDLLVQPGKSLLQTIMTMMGAAGLAVQANNVYPALIGRPVGGATNMSKPVAEHLDGPELSDDSFASWRSKIPRIQKHVAFLRNADRSKPNEKEVKICCPRCQNFERLDTHPRYVCETGVYIARQHWCKECDGEVSSFKPLDNRAYVIDRILEQG